MPNGNPHEARLPVAAVAALVGLATLLSRAPFLGPGHGADSDAWRSAGAAAQIARTGAYTISRFPGNPLHELLTAPLTALAPWAPSAGTALMAGIAAAAFTWWMGRLGLRHAAAAGLAFGAVPGLFVTSTMPLDYPWALAGGVTALAAAASGRAALAGAALGFAIGCRLTSALFLAPLAVGAALAPGPAGRARRFGITAALGLALGALPYLPLVRAHGAGFLRWYDHGYPAWTLALKKLGPDLWGLAGTIAVAAGLAWVVLRAHVGVPGGDPARRAALAACAAGAAVFTAAFLRLPYKVAYALPVVPFVLGALALALPSRGFRAIALALVLSPFLGWIYQPARPDDPPRAPGDLVLRATRPPLLLTWRGPVLVEAARRREGVAYAARVLAAARRLPPRSVVVVQQWYPVLAADPAVRADSTLRFSDLLTPGEAAGWIGAGWRIHYLPGVDEQNAWKHGLDLRSLGAAALPVEP